MLADLERLIRLQQLETAVAEARQAIEAFPAQRAALETRLAGHAARVEAAGQRLKENRTNRLALEKELAAAQTQLTRSRDRVMEVKTTAELHAVQHEIAGGKEKVDLLEHQILESLLEADELSAAAAEARQALAAEEAAVGEEQRRLAEERDGCQQRVDRHATDRAAITSDLDARALDTFDILMRGRKGVAVSEVRGGRCRSCQVRLRPQLENDVRMNQRLIQCESCQRILHFPPAADPQPAETPSSASESTSRKSPA